MIRGKRRLIAGRLKVPLVIENRYVLKLRRIMQAVHKEYFKTLELDRQDAYHPKTGHLQVLGTRIQLVIKKPVEEAFDQMAHGIQRANKLALQHIEPNDLRLGAEIQKARDANVQYMRNAARTYADDVAEIMNDPATWGKRVEDIAKDIQERSGVSESKAELIARDQTLKLNGAINKTRQENAGVTKYIWNTSHDERVRESHRELDGQTFSWSDPPEPGHPGEDIQCRCIAIPIFDETEE